jgi:hypothetical protein
VRARRDLCGASAVRRRGSLRCNGFATLRKTLPTSATHILAARTSSRSFPGSWLDCSGSSTRLLAWVSVGPACPPAASRTLPRAHRPATAISTIVFSAKRRAGWARACWAFCCDLGEKPIALDGCKFCYRGPGTGSAAGFYQQSSIDRERSDDCEKRCVRTMPRRHSSKLN